MTNIPANYTERGGLKIYAPMVAFFEDTVLPPLEIAADSYWSDFARYLETFAPENAALLTKRENIQQKLDSWHAENPGPIKDQNAYQAMLKDIGYLVDEPAEFTITTDNVDAEIARLAGPQLVVPSLNDRFVLNAANARWGSLYDAFYGTDALDAAPAQPGGYDTQRGAAVIKRVREFLDDILPLKAMSWHDWQGGDLPLSDPEAFVGRRGDNYLFHHNGLHIEIIIDPAHPIGKTDPAHIADVHLEAALTTIVDMEDSVAAVDGEDKLTAYRNWFGLICGDLSSAFQKGGKTMHRTLNADRHYEDAQGDAFSLPGRSLLFVRNVGHLMTNPAVLLADGSEAPEGLLDGWFTATISSHDVRGLGQFGNSRHGSIYIVKPKMHGPEECAFSHRCFNAIEDALGLDRYSMKIGVMDEERRTSANLAACIHAVKERIVFINTGFLDRTGDEIHTIMQAGAVTPKGAMKQEPWINAYEDRNVTIGLACGLSGKAQIGKGMWAAPDKMADMMEQKIGHPLTGANTAWVPSPTAATLHAMHYHQVDVFAHQQEIGKKATPSLDALLTLPLCDAKGLSADAIQHELDNNAQGLLGYVVRWIDHGVGCSKVPDINDIGLMEDRATLRISSQHIANWLHHGLCTRDQVMETLRRMAAKVDEQNAGDPLYKPMTDDLKNSLAFDAACALIFAGREQPSGYTEPLLHRFRQEYKGKA